MSSDRQERKELLEALGKEASEHSTRTIMFHEAIAEKLGLNATDHKCLAIIDKTGPISAGQLAELTGLTTGAITGVIDRLERAGFVRRAKDPNDRRKVIVEPLQEEAERRIAPLFESLARAMNELCSRYSDEELALILKFMRESSRMMHEEALKLRKGAAPKSPGQVEGDEGANA